MKQLVTFEVHKNSTGFHIKTTNAEFKQFERKKVQNEVLYDVIQEIAKEIISNSEHSVHFTMV